MILETISNLVPEDTRVGGGDTAVPANAQLAALIRKEVHCRRS